MGRLGRKEVEMNDRKVGEKWEFEWIGDEKEKRGRRYGLGIVYTT